MQLEAEDVWKLSRHLRILSMNEWLNLLARYVHRGLPVGGSLFCLHSLCRSTACRTLHCDTSIKKTMATNGNRSSFMEWKEDLVTMYRHNNFFERLSTPISKLVIEFLETHLARYGIPDTLTSDNEPQFSMYAFRNFAKNVAEQICDKLSRKRPGQCCWRGSYKSFQVSHAKVQKRWRRPISRAA